MSEPALARKADGWSVESWVRFWGAPDPAVARVRIPTIVRSDVVAFWPGGAPEVVGPQAYGDYVVALLRLVPDLKLRLEEYAVNGDSYFLRWTGSGTGPSGRFEMAGVDRVKLREGLVDENRIYSDAAVFPLLASRRREDMKNARRETMISPP